MVTTAGINLPHTSFTIRQCPTVKEVWFHSDRSCWNSRRHALLQRGGHGARHIEGMTIVCWKLGSETEAQARRWLRSRLELWSRQRLRSSPRARARRSLRSRPRGSGEAESASEAKGVGRDGACARGLRGQAFLLLLFAAFYSLNLGIYFTIPNTMFARARTLDLIKVTLMVLNFKKYDRICSKLIWSGAVSRFCDVLCLWGSKWSLNCKNNNFISPSISCNNVVTKFKNGMRLNFLNLGICTLCIVKKSLLNVVWSY
jgi:hypothetical protein